MPGLAGAVRVSAVVEDGGCRLLTAHTLAKAQVKAFPDVCEQRLCLQEPLAAECQLSRACPSCPSGDQAERSSWSLVQMQVA